MEPLFTRKAETETLVQVDSRPYRAHTFRVGSPNTVSTQANKIKNKNVKETKNVIANRYVLYDEKINVYLY